MTITSRRKKTERALSINVGTALVLTTSFQTVIPGPLGGGWIGVEPHSNIKLLLTFVGFTDETGLELKTEVEDGLGTDGFEEWRAIAGTAEPDLVAVVFASDPLPASGRIALAVGVAQSSRLRLLARKVAGSGNPTLVAEYLGG